MNKYFSLIKASMSEGMNIYKVSSKKKSKATKVFLPIILTFFIMGAMYSYSEMIMSSLEPVHAEFVLLTIFIILTSLLTLVEGIYKTGNLLFNCKDDNLLLSLPIKRRAVLFIRVFKFYIFELAYNSLFLIPALAVYAVHTNPNAMFYVVSLIGLFLFPIFPILISCLIGTITTYISSKFKGKRAVETILTFIILIGVLYVSYNSEGILNSLTENATSINEIITKFYYPAGTYIDLVLNFNPLKLLEFVGVNLALFAIAIWLIGKVYFRVNSRTKSVKTKSSNINYVIKTNKPVSSLVKKEFSRFVNSTVFITNAGFGLVLFIIGCILLNIKFDEIVSSITQVDPSVSVESIRNYVPVILLILVSFSSFMTSITSSMISLEGKSFNILKSLPVKPYIIVNSKIYAAILIMLPCILIGDLIVFVNFHFDILNTILIIIASFLCPLLSETIGIIVNLKYPRMDAKNDTEVVKQSMSSMISVFIGMALTGLSGLLLLQAIGLKLQQEIIILSFIGIVAVIYACLLLVLRKISDKYFNNIVV